MHKNRRWHIYTNHHLQGEATEHKGYRSLQQQEVVNPPFECCEIVIWWKALQRAAAQGKGLIDKI